MSPKKKSELEPPALERPMLLVTGVWTWARDRRFPRLASWFNAQVAAGHVLIRDLVILELTRLTPNKARAEEVTRRLDAFQAVPIPPTYGHAHAKCNSCSRPAATIGASHQSTC